jgi:RNA polymerase sigma-70 factor (ECF subfamily)
MNARMHPPARLREQREAGTALIERARTDITAFGEIYDLYVDRVFQFCFGHSRSREDAEDLTAETFTRALRALHRPTGEHGSYEERGVPFSAFLLRIAARLAITMMERAERKGTLSLDMGTPGEDDDAPLGVYLADERQRPPEQVVEDWERAAQLNDALAQLPPEHREVLQLAIFEELSWAEIARRLGCSEAAAKKRRERALVRLRLALQPAAGKG